MEVSKLLKKEIKEKDKKAIAITKGNQEAGEMERKLRAELSEAQLGRRTAQAKACDNAQIVEQLHQKMTCAEVLYSSWRRCNVDTGQRLQHANFMAGIVVGIQYVTIVQFQFHL